MKYGNVTLGQVEAAINKLGGREIWEAWLRGELTVEVKETIKQLFDKNGRRIPENLSAGVCDADRDFRLDRPKLETARDYSDRVRKLEKHLGAKTGITGTQLKAETERLLAMIGENSRIANILNGVCLPIVLPKLATGDLGVQLELYLTGADKSYAEAFGGDRKFCNHREGTLESEVSIVPGSRHDRLIERMKQGPVVGIYFPAVLQGFSVNASREQMQALPDGLILSGLDAAIAMAMYPEVLARDWDTPGLDLAALQWQSSGCSLSFKALVVLLFFGSADGLGDACDGCSGGLLFLG